MSFKIKHKSEIRENSKHLTDYMKNLINSQSYQNELNDHNSIKFCDVRFNYLMKNLLLNDEFCPKCSSKMNYEKIICNGCGFDFNTFGYDIDDFKIMKKFINFINDHITLKEECKNLLNMGLDEDKLFHELYTFIYYDELLKQDYIEKGFNDFVNLDELFNVEYSIHEINKSLDKKYALNTSNDEYNFSIDLNQYKVLIAIDKYENMDFALFDVPVLLREALKNLIIKEDFIKYSDSNKIKLTNKAYNYLDEHQWMDFFIEFLYNFDFSDFLDYYTNNNGKIQDVSIKYLNQHLIKAKNNLDFHYLNKCLKAQSEIYYAHGRFKEALSSEMKIFCLNINPICLNIEEFQSFKPLDIENINKLYKLKSQLGNFYFFDSFNKNWNYLNFHSVIISKEYALNILDNALYSLNLDEDNKFVKEEFFEKFY